MYAEMYAEKTLKCIYVSLDTICTIYIYWRDTVSKTILFRYKYIQYYKCSILLPCHWMIEWILPYKYCHWFMPVLSVYRCLCWTSHSLVRKSLETPLLPSPLSPHTLIWINGSKVAPVLFSGAFIFSQMLSCPAPDSLPTEPCTMICPWHEEGSGGRGVNRAAGHESTSP